MKYFPFIWAQLWRQRQRTILTLVSIIVAFFIFGILQGIDVGFGQVIDAARLDRLMTVSRFGVPLPIADAGQIERVPGIAVVAPRGGLAGYYQNSKNRIYVLCVDERWFAIYPEIPITKEQIAAFAQTRAGVIVTALMAQQYNWKVGDKIPIQSQLLKQDGTSVWTFDLVAILPDTDMFPNGLFAANYSYFDEARAANRGTTLGFSMRISNPDKATEISDMIDELFVSSTAPTRTQSERTNAQQSFQRAIDINLVTDAITGAVFFMLLFLTSSTMMQSVRERIPEFAVLKTIGFTDGKVLALVLAESLLICVLAALLGLGLSDLVMPRAGRALNIALPTLPVLVVVNGLVTAIVMALVSGLPPAWRARRLVIVDALAGR